MSKLFTTFATKTSQVVGSHWSFLFAFLIVVVWGVSGPIFNFSDTWQLVINTGTTIITFLMVFLIQNTQNRDAKAMHLKLDELIATTKAAHNEMIDIEDLSDEKLKELATYYKQKKEECNDAEINAIAKDVSEPVASDKPEAVTSGTV
ncbi:MAG: low affinity iron permease family protein [Blastocatellia bacterium]